MPDALAIVYGMDTTEMVEKVRQNMLRLVGDDTRLERLRSALEGCAGC